MRIWKRLLNIALCLCAAVCVMSVSASAEGEHTEHPICGANHENIGDHTGTCEKVTWKEWDGTSEISYDSNNTACVYLSADATPSSTLKVSNGQTLNLCLNGKTLSSTSTVIEVKGNATLNICDCHGGGAITRNSGCVIEVNTRDRVNKKPVLGTATLNLYGGKLSTGAASNSGTVFLYNNNGNEPKTVAVFNMYGGGVNNTGSGDAVDVSYASIGTGYYNINMYDGSVTCPNGNGFGISYGGSANNIMQIAGGTITGGNAALSVLGNLTLSGSPTICHKRSNGVDIDITTSGATTPNDYITVTGDFAPAEGTKISVEKSVGSSGSVLIAKPAAGASPLSSKAQHFVFAEEGYFVESNNDGDLQLTACAITGQPTVENSYTVTANGSDDKVTYQWYSAKQGNVPVADTTVTNKGNLNYTGEKWSAYPIPSNGEVTGFTLTMKKDAVMALLFPDAEDIPGRVTINSASISDSTGNHTVHKNSSDFETVTETEWP